MFHLFLAPADARRVVRALDKLRRLGLRNFALTGGEALEAGLIARGCAPQLRSLNDLDIVVESFGALSPALAHGFLFRHIHPRALPGKTLLQLVDPVEALRVDVFGACGATLARAPSLPFPGGALAAVSLEDLAARAASLLMNLARGSAVPAKHARDFERLIPVLDPGRMAVPWADQRKSSDPRAFQEAVARIADLVPSRPDLLILPDYSHDANAVCPNCNETETFRLAPSSEILSILGYC